MLAIIILSIVNVTFIIAILLQIIFIRLKIGNNIKDDSKSIEIQRKGLNIYALTMYREVLDKCNMSGTVDYIMVNNLINTSFAESYLPYFDITNNSVFNTKVMFTRNGLLCVETNDSAYNLVDDVLNNDVSYISLNNNILKIIYDNKLNDEINTYMSKNDITLKRFIVFVLYSIRDHLILDPNVNDRLTKNEVSFSFTPVLGTITSLGTRNTINLVQLLPPTSSFHVIAYSIK